MIYFPIYFDLNGLVVQLGKKTTGISSEGNKIQCNRESFSERKARSLCSCCSFLNSPTKRGCFIYSNTALWQVGRGERVARKRTTIQKGCVYSKIVSGDSGEGGKKQKGTI